MSEASITDLTKVDEQVQSLSEDLADIDDLRTSLALAQTALADFEEGDRARDPWAQRVDDLKERITALAGYKIRLARAHDREREMFDIAIEMIHARRVRAMEMADPLKTYPLAQKVELGIGRVCQQLAARRADGLKTVRIKDIQDQLLQAYHTIYWHNVPIRHAYDLPAPNDPDIEGDQHDE
jgi:hypothetical protein